MAPPDRRLFGLIFAAIVAVIAVLVWNFAPAVLDSQLNLVRPSKTVIVSDHAYRLHATLRIVDLHADSLLWNRDLLQRNNRGHADIPRLRDGMVCLQAFTIVTKMPFEMRLEGNSDKSDLITLLAIVEHWPISSWGSLTERALYQADKLQQFAKDSNGVFRIIRSKKDLDDYLISYGKSPGLLAGFLGIEGAHALEGDLRNVDVLYDAGVRMIAPTHFFDNDIGSSAHGLADNGLTEKGKQMIRKMQERRMVVDLAHASPKTIDDVVSIAKAPVIVSHTGVKGTCNNVRNLSDDQIRAIAKTGGVIGIGYWSTAVCGTDARAIARAIHYAVKKIGVDHVALGSDFDGATTVPFSASELTQLTQALIDEGLTDDEIKQVMGENAIRVLSDCLPRD
ncbi:MAG: dipeptidase [Candidatus Obscuribacterales bacterium]|nr:dipeptidase [Candidatus Obscuribacterales bacterium]